MSKSSYIKKIESVQKNCLSCLHPATLINILGIHNIIKLEVVKFGWKLTHHELPIFLQKCALTTAHGSLLIKNHWYHTKNKRIPNIPIEKKESL